MLECDRPCERLLGSGRFLLLTLAAAVANVGCQWLSQPVTGSSQVLWAWGPPLVVALLWARRAGAGRNGAASRVRVVLGIMYLAVTAGMTLLPYLVGWRGEPLTALWLGNRYHIVATAVGAAGAWAWRREIEARLERVAVP